MNPIYCPFKGCFLLICDKPQKVSGVGGIWSVGQEQVLPRLFLQRDLAKDDDFFYGSGQSDLDEVEESSVSDVAN